MPRYTTTGQLFHVYPEGRYFELAKTHPCSSPNTLVIKAEYAYSVPKKEALATNGNFSCYLKIGSFLNEENFYDPRDWLFRILNSDKA